MCDTNCLVDIWPTSELLIAHILCVLGALKEFLRCYFVLVLLQSLLTPPYWEFLSTNTEILHSDGQSWGILHEVELEVDENYEWGNKYL